MHIIKYLKDVEKYGSDAGQVSQSIASCGIVCVHSDVTGTGCCVVLVEWDQSHDSLMRRRRERIVKKTSRPVSDASSLSSSSSSDG